MNVSPTLQTRGKWLPEEKKNLQQFIRPDKLQCFTLFFYFFILSPNWASREAAACKCPRGEHMFSDVWGFVSIWENDSRTWCKWSYILPATAVLDTTLGNVTESICQFVSRGLQQQPIATVWLSHFEWILFFFIFLRKNPDPMECFQGIVEKFYDRDTIFGRFFTVSFSVNYQNAAFCFHCQNSKEPEKRWEWKFRFQKSRTAVANSLSSFVARLFYYCHAFLVVAATKPAPLSENCCVVCFIFTTLLFYCVKW